MPLWYAAALAYQSALHAIFFIVFLNGKHPARAFGILWTLLVFVLFPIGSWIGEYDLFIKNAFFCGSLVVLCRFLFRDQKMRKIILAVLLYEIMLVLFEILAVPTMYLLFGFVPDLRM